MKEINTWEELFENVKKGTDASGKMSFKEYKKSAHPRTFTEMFGENSQDRLKESGTYNDIYKNHLTEASIDDIDKMISYIIDIALIKTLSDSEKEIKLKRALNSLVSSLV